MEEHIKKPDRATGTRWVQHKSRALKSLILGYNVIVAHLKAMTSIESTVKPENKAKFKGYLTRLASYKFALHMLFFDALLEPLATLSFSLQGLSADLPLAVAKLKAFQSAVSKLKDDSPDSEGTVNPEYITVLKANNLQEIHGITFFIITFFYISGGAKISSHHYN